MHSNRPHLLFAATIIPIVSFAFGTHAERTIFACSGFERGTDQTRHARLPPIPSSRLFALDDKDKSLSEYLDKQWTLLDANPLADATGISARYSRDYQDGRVDVIFEFNRVNDALILIMDLDEKPVDIFAAQCQVSQTGSQSPPAP